MKQRLIKGILSSYYGQAITILFQLLSVPLFLNYWGEEKYSEWIVIYTIPSIIGMMELGIFNVIINEIISLRNRMGGFNKEAYKLASTANTFLLLLSLTSITMTLILFFYGNGYLYSLVFAYSTILILTNYYNVLFKITCEYHIASFIANTIRLLEYVFIFACVYFGTTIQIVFVLLLSVRAISLLLMFNFSVRKRNFCGIIRLCEFNFSTHVHIGDIFKNSLLPISMIFNNQVLIILIKNYFGDVFVIMFSTMRTFFRLSNQITSAINMSMWQEFLRIRGDREYIKSVLNNLLLVNFFILLVLFFFYSILGEYIYVFWTKDKISYDYFYYVSIMISVLFYSLWQPMYIYLNSLKCYFSYSFFYFLLQVIILLSLLSELFNFGEFVLILMMSEILMFSYLCRLTLFNRKLSECI
ncbi:hypothetical protein [Citrobacter freundii]|uniref:hypothetical protein n=1 Tax=Enterobacteriaceae TaxID=543 RepID=UPI00157B6EE5|nr:hypothetical protein [Citrobacter freundii]